MPRRNQRCCSSSGRTSIARAIMARASEVCSHCSWRGWSVRRCAASSRLVSSGMCPIMGRGRQSASVPNGSYGRWGGAGGSALTPVVWEAYHATTRRRAPRNPTVRRLAQLGTWLRSRPPKIVHLETRRPHWRLPGSRPPQSGRPLAYSGRQPWGCATQ